MADHAHREPEEGYTGPALLTVDGRGFPVHARLDARHEPLDGRLHWFGRIRIDDAIEAPDIRGGNVELSTEGGHAPAHIGDVDPWGRYHVTGVGPPPYRLDQPVPDEPGH
jgi:hypothetical protein